MGQFTNEDIRLAEQVQEKYGVPASVTLAQYALESGYGKSTVGQNNYFNIKGTGTGGYKDYQSKEDAFMDYGRLLTTERYTEYTQDATTVQEYVQGIYDAGYAEDINYVSKIMSVIKSNNLQDAKSSETIISNNTGISTAGDSVNGWGQIVVVVFALLLVVMGVVFVGIAVTSSTPIGDTIKDVTSIVKKVKTGRG